MSSRVLLALFDSAYVIALSAWVGSILFFSFGVAPVIFSALGEAAGGKFVCALFPRYYLWGAIAGAIALPAFVAGPLCYHEFRGPMVGVQALVILACTLCMLYGGNSLTPAINQARDAGPAGHDQFNRLHRRAVRLNGLVLLAGIGLLIAFAARPAPRTSGIVELTPAERARFDSGVNRVIQDVEARYGLRPPRKDTPDEPGGRDPLIDDETVAEIESFYAKKHRAGSGPCASRLGRGFARRSRPREPTYGPPKGLRG